MKPEIIIPGHVYLHNSHEPNLGLYDECVYEIIEVIKPLKYGTVTCRQLWSATYG